MGDVDAGWVPNGESADPPYDPGPVDGEIVGEQYSDEELLAGLENVPPREDILAGLEEFREPFAQTRRREIAAALWPEYENEIWTGAWEAPSTDDIDPSTGELINGVKWSDVAGCPVHVQATSDQESSIKDQSINDANAAVDSIVQRYEAILDDTNYENSLQTAQRISKAHASLEGFSDDELGLFGTISELFESHWTGDLASDKGQRFFGADVLKGAAGRQWEIAEVLRSHAADEVRAQVTVHATLGMAVYDTYEAMAKKTHLNSIEYGVLQTIADAVGTIGLVFKLPGVANATSWASGMITKAGDFKITISRENIASTNDIAAWTADLVEGVDTAESGLEEVRTELSDGLTRYLGNIDVLNVDYIPGEGYQDE
ncbi:hypothetical protein [Glycomyces sp. NPDC048151]|uniref:hypothetical protein n=1 Tax=Glycomyces sp. NPDC048151 TaxID=3364002 RepID=UPI003721C396